jgi:hypothetical protein
VIAQVVTTKGRHANELGEEARVEAAVELGERALLRCDGQRWWDIE